MNPIELLMRRRNVSAFIKADPVEVVVSREGEPEKTAAGGMRRGAPVDPLSPQQARIVLNKRRYTAGIVNSEAGDIPRTDYLLIAMHDKNFKVNDTFTWLGNHYKIVGISENRQESILAAVDFLGKKNRNA